MGGLLIIAAIVYLIVTSMQSTAQYFYTITELQAKGASAVGQNLRASGAVMGSSITYDPKTLTITFYHGQHLQRQQGHRRRRRAGRGAAPGGDQPERRAHHGRLRGPKPDLLKDEAQAIVTGKLGADGVFHADELLLKCPTRYQDALPSQAAQTGN